MKIIRVNINNISSEKANYDIDGLKQERRISIANALELHLSCTNPSICPQNFVLQYWWLVSCKSM